MFGSRLALFVPECSYLLGVAALPALFCLSGACPRFGQNSAAAMIRTSIISAWHEDGRASPSRSSKPKRCQLRAQRSHRSLPANLPTSAKGKACCCPASMCSNNCKPPETLATANSCKPRSQTWTPSLHEWPDPQFSSCCVEKLLWCPAISQPRPFTNLLGRGPRSSVFRSANKEVASSR